MTTEIVVTCDGCGQPIVPPQERIQVTAMQIDTGDGITSAPVMRDYHAEHVPGEVEAIGYKHGNLKIKEEDKGG